MLRESQKVIAPRCPNRRRAPGQDDAVAPATVAARSLPPAAPDAEVPGSGLAAPSPDQTSQIEVPDLLARGLASCRGNCRTR